ncbi:MAG: hypothetical protein ACR2M4_05335 [Actinomycetota bacterium]
MTNSREYDRALVDRGSVTVRFDEDFFAPALASGPERQTGRADGVLGRRAGAVEG